MQLLCNLIQNCKPELLDCKGIELSRSLENLDYPIWLLSCITLS
ncbi:MAG: hypothetical protein ACOX7X_03025 [Methanosarcina flavescens]|nr:hypothetical protein [Methanosarcina flavescens]